MRQTPHEKARVSAETAHVEVELLIARTPTGDKRNLYTEANIHLLLAIEKLREVEKGDDNVRTD